VGLTGQVGAFGGGLGHRIAAAATWEEIMPHTYEELKSKTIDELRGIAKGVEHEAVKGYTQMNKEHLLPALCKALGIDTHAHHHAVGIDKSALKKMIHDLKLKRDEAIEAHDHHRLKDVRRQIHRLNRRIRAASV
jgi:DNA polymerase III epsilon subunit-like protein